MTVLLPTRYEQILVIVCVLLQLSEAFMGAPSFPQPQWPLIKPSASSTIARRSSKSVEEDFNTAAATGATTNVDDKEADALHTYYSPNVPLDDERWNKAFEKSGETDRADDDGQDIVNEYSFFDEAIINVRAGSGGQGANTYKKVGNQNGPPDGGNGGKGGNVILKVDKSINTLAGLTNAWRPNSFGGSGAAASTAGGSRVTTTTIKSFRAENGGDGQRQFRNGRYGQDVTIRVPPGTVVQEQVVDRSTDKIVGLVDLGILGSRDDEHNTLIVAQGGEGGEGTGITGKARGVRRPRVPPKGGERKTLKLTLKIVADVALVGVPNAGKSTFLAAVTRAKPKIANYPFTTIIPNLGVWIPASDKGQQSNSKGAGSEGLVMCDVPGLIAGAARGIGLGHAFLRHVERCHVIVHLIDATSNDPIADYQMLNEEITKYQKSQLANMPQVVVVNKIDAFDSQSTVNDWEEGLQARWTRGELERGLREVVPHSRLMWMSAREREGVEELMTRLAAFVKKVKDSKDIGSQ